MTNQTRGSCAASSVITVSLAALTTFALAVFSGQAIAQDKASDKRSDAALASIDRPLASGSTTGSLSYGGKTHVVQAAAPSLEASRQIFKLQLPDGSIVLSDHAVVGAKVLAQMPVSLAPDSAQVAQRERDYWKTRDRELTARLTAEREQEAQKRQLAAAREAELARINSQELVWVHQGRVVRRHHSNLPYMIFPTENSPGARNGQGVGIASGAGSR